jgi:leucyl-tRNA synthetase
VIDEATGSVIVSGEAPDAATLTAMHRTIAGVREDYEHLRFNTAIAKLIELNNVLTKLDTAPRAVVEALVVMVAPVAPHIAEELWRRLGHEGGATYVRFPEAEPALLVEETVTCVIQVKGKVRDRVEVPATIGEDELRTLVLAREKVVAAIPDGVRTVIVRAPRLVNVVPA